MTAHPSDIDPVTLLTAMQNNPSKFSNVIRQAARIDPQTFATVIRHAHLREGRVWP